MRAVLQDRYKTVRDLSEQICKPLEIEDYIIQSMPDVSPTRWHLAHTTWFFETFILKPQVPGYQSPNALYNYLFNSYYNEIGKQFPRPERGLLSRPTVKQVFAYRQHVDQTIANLIENTEEDKLASLFPLFDLGLNHEQQHQELMLTDLKHVFFKNPLYPAYANTILQSSTKDSTKLSWTAFEGGIVDQGFPGDTFSFDNETPRHEVLLQPFELGNRLVTNAEYLTFMEDGGYEQAPLWLSDGWAKINQEGWQAPLYWVMQDGNWFEFTLNGLVPLNPQSPVTHISYYEADAYANWADARLPSEFEWEHAAHSLKISGNFIESQLLHPAPLKSTGFSKLSQMFGDVWEWTRSPYTPYPGFKPAQGAVGEYNGKFMSSQMVLRGGSCVSSQNHLRSSYRNFFYPHSRWQFMGMRLARDIT